MTTHDYTVRLDLAKRKCHLLYEELQKVNHTIKDTLLHQASAELTQITPKRYLRQYNTLRGHQDKIAQVQWSADSVKLVLACQDGFLIIWDAVTGLKLQAVPLDSRWVLLCAFAPSGRFVALAGLDNRCTVYKVMDTTESYLQPGIELQDQAYRTRPHSAYVSACEFISDEKILTASGDMTVALWDVHKDCKLQEFVDHCGDVLLLSISPGERGMASTFLSAGADGCVKLWDLRQKGHVASCQMSRVDINCVTQFSDGNTFILGDDDGICKTYDFRSLCELEQYNLREQFEPTKSPTHRSPTSAQSFWQQFDAPGVVSLDVSRLGRILYACYADYGCLAWDVLRREIVELIGIGGGSHASRISQVTVSQDGQGVATASWDATIKIWST